MSTRKSMRLQRVTWLGVLSMLAVLATFIAVSPAVAHHRTGHDGGHTTDPGGGETATFEMVASGDLDGSVEVTKANGPESLIHNNPEVGEELVLDMGGFFANVSRDGWGNCFAGGTFSGGLQIVADKNDPGFGSVSFWFTAEGKDGTPDIKYQLLITHVTIDPTDRHWLPSAVGDIATVTTVTGTWEMLHSNGPGRKVACTGEGTGETLDFTIVITRLS